MGSPRMPLLRRKCRSRSVVFGQCGLLANHQGPHRDKRKSIEWKTVGDLTLRTDTRGQRESLAREIHDRTGKRPIPWLVETCLEDAERETPPCDYSVADRPDILDSERDDLVQKKTLARVLEIMKEVFL